MATETESKLFHPIEEKTLASRLIVVLSFTLGELIRRPGAYLTMTFFPAGGRAGLVARLVGQLAASGRALISHPIGFIKGALSPDEIGRKRKRVFLWVLSGSAVVHGVFIVYLIYLAVLAPYMNIRMVEKDYNKLDLTEILKPLHYPSGMLRPPSTAKPMSLEEIKARDKKKREEAEKREEERKAREEAERKAEEARKEAEAKKAAEDAKAAEANKPSTQYGEINVNPLKDIISEIYELSQAGKLDLNLSNLSIQASFRVMKDGSIPKETIKITHSSGNKLMDEKCIEVLWRLGESHALSPLSILTSNTIRLELNDSVARLTITSFAPTPDEAASTAKNLNWVLGMAKWSQQKKNPGVAELLGLLHLTSDNKRVDANLTVPRARADELMRAQFSKTPPGSTQ